MSFVYKHHDGVLYVVEQQDSDITKRLTVGKIFDRHKNEINFNQHLYHRDYLGTLKSVYARSVINGKFYWLIIKNKVATDNDIKYDFS